MCASSLAWCGLLPWMHDQHMNPGAWEGLISVWDMHKNVASSFSFVFSFYYNQTSPELCMYMHAYVDFSAIDTSGTHIVDYLFFFGSVLSVGFLHFPGCHESGCTVILYSQCLRTLTCVGCIHLHVDMYMQYLFH